jgi:hypothetical protein
MSFPFTLYPPHFEAILNERSATYNSEQRYIIPTIHSIFLSSVHSKLSTAEYKGEKLHVKAISRRGREINTWALI